MKKHRAEVIDVCITEYDEELHERTLRAESIAEGELIAIRKMIDAGIEKEVILIMYSEEEYKKALTM